MSHWEKERRNYAKLEEKEEMLLTSYRKLNQSRKEDVWFLDIIYLRIYLWINNEIKLDILVVDRGKGLDMTYKLIST